MDIKIHEQNGIKIIQFDGEFSVFFQDEIEDKIHSVLISNPAKVILDLTNVNYLDSSGISIIVTTAQRLRSKVNLAGCQANVKYVLELAEIDEIVNYYDTLEEAINSI